MDSFALTESIVSGSNNQDGHEAATDTGKLPEGVNKFQRAIAAWRGIDLSNTIAKLDTTASDIVAQQRDALVQRKDLAQKTKDFRKLDDATKLTEYKSLLKAYQSFIDVLTNQGKASSNAFLQLYSSLSEAPDPYPLLEASIDSLVHSEETVPKLTSERNQLQGNVDRLTSQLEDTEKRLQEERAARKKLEDNQDSKIREIESSWSAVLSEKSNNWTAKEKSLEEKVENQERLIKELKASYEVSQRLGQDDDAGDSPHQGGATAAELELVSADLEKTSLRLAEVEARNEQLTLELAQVVSHSQPEQTASVEEDPAYLRLQSENSSLLRKLDAARFDRESERHSWEAKISQSERHSVKVVAERDELRVKLEKVADYEDIRRELEMIKSIEFSAGDDDDIRDLTDSATAPANGAASKDGAKNSLEQLLLSRNKKLTDELTVLRVSHRDLQGQLEALREDLTTTKGELEKSQKLSATLENDLLRVQEEAANAFPSSAMSVTGTYTSKHPYSRRGGTSPTSSIISGLDHSSGSSNTMDAIRAGEAVGGGSGLLPMIQAQRDRFKKKNAELEEELSEMYNTVKTLRQEVSSLQKDNLSLYEKTRYVSTYNRGQGGSSSASAYGNKPNPSSVHLTSDTPSGLSLDRYQSAYEAQISPFAAFRGRESARAYKRMSLPERMVFSLTRIILANRTSRNLFAGYCFAIHILLFAVLYMMSTVEIEKHSANLGAAAMVGGVGGGSSYGGGQELNGDDWQQEGFHHAG
ncbi:CASP C terminal-domain-containing protein [Aspergillus coremiiformis]|uniref:Protein CASP n=1 Tax=Aspergillus coremiiformis TaxID=138285 RepID=A0A5N6ZBB8_9EURO|nr:CASP C terminal-domain-containing protein [Aspergillus coremiiformis]